MSMQELKSMDCCGFSIQSMAGGQLGEARAAVFREWLPGAPCSYAARAEHVNSRRRSGTIRKGVYPALLLWGWRWRYCLRAGRLNN